MAKRKRNYIPRKQFKFWLRLDVDREIKLIEFSEYLIKTNQFATTVRNGLRLMWSLGQGDTSVLLELFPKVVQQLYPDQTALIATFQAMIEKGGVSVPVSRTLPTRVPQPVLQQPIAQEVDTSEAFLNAF